MAARREDAPRSPVNNKQYHAPLPLGVLERYHI